MLAVRARALIEGRLAPSIDDVLALAEPVLKHRMALTFAARADGETIPEVIRALTARFERQDRQDDPDPRPAHDAPVPGRRETDAALALANRMPRLVLEARRVAASLVHGLHGRRRAGPGESFWQFRPFVAGEAAQRIDWRRSGRDDHLYVREREWEAATRDLAVDRPLGLDGLRLRACQRAEDRPRPRARACAGRHLRGGGRARRPHRPRAPRATRHIAERLAEALVADRAGLDADLPPARPLGLPDEAVMVGDFLGPADVTRAVEGCRRAARAAIS